MGDVENPESGGRKRPWQPFVWIIVAAALAHLWCLGSQFYMDDLGQIRDNEVVRSGRFWEMGLSGWTYLGYHLQWRLFGVSAVGFHAVNWLLHTASACVLFAFGRDFLRGRWPTGVALFGAVLFAVHPLASEIPNYARTQDLAWVTLFSLLAAWAVMAFMRGGGWLKLAACGVCVLGAMFSKGPGLLHAVMAVGAVGLACVEARQVAALRRNLGWIVGAGVVIAVALWMSGSLDFWLQATKSWADPRFAGHGYTVSRVFWEFAWRGLIPVGLSSDHHIAETLIPAGGAWWKIPDKVAMLAVAGLFALAAFSAFLGWRKSTRLFGVCLFLFVMTILSRLLFLIPEFMPEYRIYPGMPWFCLGMAIALAAAWKWMFPAASPRVPAVLLVLVFTALSAKRSFLWHDLDRLTADVLDRYPARARAVWELDDRDVAAGNWKAIIDRHSAMWPGVERKFVAENQRLFPARELPSGDFVLAMVAHMGRYARAVAHLQGPAAGLRVLAQVEAHMKLMKMTPENKPLEWGYFYHSKALVLELAGNPAAAAELLRRKEVPKFWPHDLARVEKKLAAVQP